MSVIAEVLGRPIAFHRAFVGLGIGVTGAVMLSQAIYWSRRADAEDGWFYKTQDDWEAETGLTRREQETARRRLTAICVLKEERRGVPAKMFYYVDQQALADALGVHTSMAESANLASTKAPRQYGGKRQSIDSTETTTETTTEKGRAKHAGKQPNVSVAGKPDGVDQSDWDDWLLTRKEKRAGRPTEAAMRRLEKQAQKAGLTTAQAIRYAAENSWVGFNADWYTNREGVASTADNGVGVNFI